MIMIEMQSDLTIHVKMYFKAGTNAFVKWVTVVPHRFEVQQIVVLALVFCISQETSFNIMTCNSRSSV